MSSGSGFGWGPSLESSRFYRKRRFLLSFESVFPSLHLARPSRGQPSAAAPLAEAFSAGGAWRSASALLCVTAGSPRAMASQREVVGSRVFRRVCVCVCVARVHTPLCSTRWAPASGARPCAAVTALPAARGACAGGMEPGRPLGASCSRERLEKGVFWRGALFRCNCCFIRTWKRFLWLNLIKWLRITNVYT